MSEFQELEFKYKADTVKLTDFQALAEKLGAKKKYDVSSWDQYYTHKSNEDYFIRYRESDTPELTKKRKTKDANNWERVEVDLPLDGSRIKNDIVDKFVSLDGYEKNFKIYKSCFIFWFDLTNMVYYTVYDENMKEIGRYIEVEVNKDQIQEVGKDTCLAHLSELEEELEKLGISKKNRMKRSLFEIFKN